MTHTDGDALRRTWPDSGRRVKDRWSRLTDDDVTSIEGKSDHLVSRLEQRYGYARERAERECQTFVDELESSGFTTAYRSRETSPPIQLNRKETSS